MPRISHKMTELDQEVYEDIKLVLGERQWVLIYQEELGSRHAGIVSNTNDYQEIINRSAKGAFNA